MQYLAVITGIFSLEYGLKNYIEKNVAEGESRKKLGGLLLLRKHHNRGAFLNAGQARRRAVMVLSALLSLAVTGFFALVLGKPGKKLLKWGLARLLGGAYSNTYDRLVRKYVVDYVSFPLPFGLDNIIFNIGDFCIMVGALLCVPGCSGEWDENP